MDRTGNDGSFLFPLTILLPFLIPVSLIYRFIFFLINGYNPEITINTFFPQSSNEFSWKGVEMIYDFFANTPIEFITVFVWCGLVAFTLWWVGE
mgnify:CR=1 FL=1